MKYLTVLLILISLKTSAQNLGQFRTQEIVLNAIDSVYILGDGLGNNLPPQGEEIDSILTLDRSTGKIRRINRDLFGRSTIVWQFIVEQWDINVVDGTELRFNIPEYYDLYEIVKIEAYVTTAGTTNSTSIEIENITQAEVIDNSLSIASGSLTALTTGLTAEVDDGDEISIEVTGNCTTPAKGLRVFVYLSKQ